MFRLSSSIALDLRSIAFFRILFGSVLLYDLLKRLPYAELFLSDDGTLSRADLLSVVDRPWAFSVYMMFGETSQVVALLVLHALVAVCLILGLWTRVVSIGSWVLLLSLQHRNPLVLNGGDTLFSVYAFWLMFLPLNARWSLDSLLAKEGAGGGVVFPRNRYVALPGVALMAQTIFVYVFTVLLKSGEMWSTGDVVHYVVRNLGLIKEPAVWFQQFEGLLVPLSRVVFHWEWFGLVLLVCPFANWITRSVAVVGYMVLHVSFGFMLDIAIFAPVSILGWVALIPGEWWNLKIPVVSRLALGDRLKELGTSFPILRVGKVMRPGVKASIATGVAMTLVFAWNLRGLPQSPVKEWIPKPVVNGMYLVKLRQKWGMFAPNPSRYSQWYALEAQLANGDSVDLFYPGQAFSLRRPEVFTDRLPSRRWGKFMSNLKKSRYARLREGYIDYFVDRWNDAVGPSSKIEKASLLWIRERIGEDGRYYDREIKPLRIVYAEDVSQIKGIKDLGGELGESEEDL